MKKKFGVGAGGKLIINMPVIGSGGEITQPVSKVQKRGVIPTDDADETYAFRKPTGFAFFDLGTRLRSAATTSDILAIREFPSLDTTAPDNDAGFFSEYIEQRSEVRGVSSTPILLVPVDEPSDAEWEYMTRVALGSRAPAKEDVIQDAVDPLGKSTVNGSARVISNSAQFSKYLFLGDAQNDAEVTWFAFPKDDEMIPAGYSIDYSPHQQILLPPYPDKTFPEDAPDGVLTDREAKPEDDAERWNTYNKDVESGLALNPMQIDAKYFKQFEGRHLILGRWSTFVNAGTPPNFRVPDYAEGWYGFYTKDTLQFKITKQPDFTADDVEYRFKVQDEIYLVPVPYAVSLAHSNLGVVFFHARWINKIITFYPTRQGTYVTGDVDDKNIPWVKRASNADAENASPDDRALTTRTTNLNYARQGSLIAMIKRGSGVFYIWSRIDMVRTRP